MCIGGDARFARRIDGTKLCLGFANPSVEAFLADDFHRNRHESVARAAKLGALAVEHAFARRPEPGFVDAARHGDDEGEGSDWLAAFGKEWQEALLAEMNVRLQPVVGLMEALSNKVTKSQ